MTLLMAIDGGGTRTRCVAVDRDGGRRGEGVAGPSNHLHVPLVTATAALRGATAASLSAAGATTEDVAMVSAGLAGVDFDGTGAEDGARMLRSIGFNQVVVHGDMVIAHRGALAGAPGVVALAGTGSSVLGIAADGTMIKAGGWGPLYGDQGSAYQLGRLGLVAAAEAFDGSGPATVLVERLTHAAGVSRFPDTVARLYSDLSGQQHVAALAPIIDACAEEGDEVAAAICRQAGDDLARAVLAVARRLPAPDRRVSYQGAVLGRSRRVREAFLRTLDAGGIELQVQLPRFEPIVGAVLLGARAAGWELALESLEMRHGV
jgi:N-acetylglucosamine kinase-like BadF-type ATPase